MRFFRVIGGTVLALCGAWQIILIFAFSTMTDARLPDADRAADRWHLLVRGSPMIGFGAVLIFLWLHVMFGRLSDWSRAETKPGSGKK